VTGSSFFVDDSHSLVFANLLFTAVVETGQTDRRKEQMKTPMTTAWDLRKSRGCGGAKDFEKILCTFVSQPECKLVSVGEDKEHATTYSLGPGPKQASSAKGKAHKIDEIANQTKIQQQS
jgi:hypothetical protein